jgi:3-hydroxyacyl-[acyl-carrier-protein] dehydratase
VTDSEPAFEDLLSRLPHGAEFRFLDAIAAWEPEHRAVARYQVRGDEFFLPGHFPGEPVMPGVLLIEMLAQAGGLAVQPPPGRDPGPRLGLAAVRQARLFGSAGPGVLLEAEARIVGSTGSVFEIEGEVRSNERILLSARLTLGIRPAEGWETRD